MSGHGRYIRDQLFTEGFAKMAKQDYAEGLEMLRIASGAEHLEVNTLGDYDPATGIFALSPVKKASRGFRGTAVDPAALVFMGSEAEFKGLIERRTGISPDYRISGYANHLGEAIAYYRKAEEMDYPVGSERIDALRLRLGHEDFQDAEREYREVSQRGQEYLETRLEETRAGMDLRAPTSARATGVPAKKGGCYIATAVYGS